MGATRWAGWLGAALLPVLLMPSAGAATIGCGSCNYTIVFKLHATVVDAATGQGIPTATFVLASATTSMPAKDFAVVCDTAEAGACASWTVSVDEGDGGVISVDAPGYTPQAVEFPSQLNGRCENAGDDVTRTFALAKGP